jgi:hypothetical protein
MGKCIMKKTALMIGITTALAISSSAAFAAIATTNQKGSLLIYPKIDVRANTATWVRIVNDGLAAVTVKCYYMDVNKNRNDFEFELTKNQPFVFDAGTGDSPQPVAQGANSFPAGQGFPGYGELVCFAVSTDGTALRNWNQLAGTATVVNESGAVEYNAWAFKAVAPTPAGDLDLNATEYDSCPAYLFGQFSPTGSEAPGGGEYGATTIDISSCKQDLRQDYLLNLTKLQFDVWRYDETRYTGAYECSNSFFEDTLDGIKVSPGNFASRLLKGPAYYRVQGVQSTQCANSTATGLVGVQTSYLPTGTVAAELGASNTAGPAGYVKWDAFGGITGKK